jgi:ankyrin repeat protein
VKLIRCRPLACVLAISACTAVVAATSTDDSLQQACAHAHVAKIAVLVKEGASPNGKGRYLGWPLYLAIRSDNASVVRLLVAKGASPNIHAGPPVGGCGPLWSAFDASLPILRTLLAAGADTNCVWADPSGAEDQSLTTPLMAAASLKGLRMGGRQLAWTNKPMRKATPRPVDVVNLLLKYGAKPNTRNYFGENALYSAIDSDDVGAARALINGGLDVNAKMDFSTPGEPNPYMAGQTALAHALMRYNDGWRNMAGIGMIHMLLEKGADPNEPPLGHYTPDCGHGPPPCGFVGETPLSYVAKRGYINIARLLLRYGAKSNEPRGDGAVPSAIAVHAGHDRMAALIAQHEKR